MRLLHPHSTRHASPHGLDYVEATMALPPTPPNHPRPTSPSPPTPTPPPPPPHLHQPLKPDRFPRPNDHHGCRRDGDKDDEQNGCPCRQVQVLGWGTFPVLQRVFATLLFLQVESDCRPHSLNPSLSALESTVHRTLCTLCRAWLRCRRILCCWCLLCCRCLLFGCSLLLERLSIFPQQQTRSTRVATTGATVVQGTRRGGIFCAVPAWRARGAD